MLPSWRLEFCGGSQIFVKFVNTVLVGKFNGRDHLEDLGVDGSIVYHGIIIIIIRSSISI
jgi:hypothetical protein